MRGRGRGAPAASTQYKRARRVTTYTGVNTEVTAETRRMHTRTQHQGEEKTHTHTRTHTDMHIRIHVCDAHTSGHLRILIPRAPRRQARHHEKKKNEFSTKKLSIKAAKNTRACRLRLTHTQTSAQMRRDRDGARQQTHTWL